jgi:hypothetical protein
MTLPNFLIIGAAKSGTTALANFLQKHPQVHIPAKEPDYFSGWGFRIPFIEPPGITYVRLPEKCDTLEQYTALFSNAGNALARGEASTSYLYEPTAAANIHQLLPDVRLVAILRQPVERAFSHFVMHMRSGHEPEQDFYKAIADDTRRRSANWLPGMSYLHGSRYPEQLSPYFQLFHSSQIRIYLYDDLAVNPAHVWDDLLHFLQVDKNFSPDFSRRYKEGLIPSPTLRLLRKWLGPVLRQTVPQQWRAQVSARLSYRPTLPANERRELTYLYFREDIARLEEMLQRDLSHWLT